MSANPPKPKKSIFRSGNFWTIVTFILGIIASYIFYIYSNKEREPVYAIKKEPSLIYDKSAATPRIKLLSDDSLIVNDNVYVASIVIWNNGSLEIQKSDVRKDFIISVSEKAKILDYKILNQVKPEISKFKLIPFQNTLKLDWDFFDPGFGAEIQLIYSANEKSRIEVDGYVLGNQIKLIKAKDNNKYQYFKWGLIFSSLSIILFFGFIMQGFIQRIKNPNTNKARKIISIFLIVSYSLFAIMTLYLVYTYFFDTYKFPL
jgi:uncharacterized membrane protein YjfL (UPF0719 family)